MGNIEYNINEYPEDAIYISMAINMGTTTRFFYYNDKQIECNLAFPNVFVNCLKRLVNNKFECNIDRTITYIHFHSRKQSFGQDLVWFIKTVLKSEIDYEMFERAKSDSIEGFKKNYKNGQFRGWMKSYEISDLNKQYSLSKLIKDLETMDYIQFKKYKEILIAASNCRMYVNGVLTDLSDEKNEVVNKLLNFTNEKPRLCGTLLNPYLRMDAHLLELSREPYNIDILSFHFDPKVSMQDRLIYMLFETEKIPMQDRIMHMDIFDASVIVNEPELQKLKNYFKRILTKEQFINKKNILLARIQHWLEKKPVRFNETYLEMAENGISLLDCIQIIMNLEYDEYERNIAKIKPIVTEAQIVLRR